MLGSSFTSPATPPLSVVNALNKTRFYTQGCDKLIVGMDHKPLPGVLNEISLESIANPILERLKEKMLGWRFKLIHIPGEKLIGLIDCGTVDLLDMKYMSGPAEEGKLAAIRTVMSADHNMLDPELDVSGCLLASMKLGIKSVSWDNGTW